MTESPRPPDENEISLDEPTEDRDLDGVDALRDVEAEEGDEEGLEDLFVLDKRAAEEVGADLDRTQRDEPRLE